jgi:hypothetical protein
MAVAIFKATKSFHTLEEQPKILMNVSWMDPTSLKLFQGIPWGWRKGNGCMAGQGGHGALDTHMVVDTPARKRAGWLRRHNRGKTPQQRKIASKRA